MLAMRKRIGKNLFTNAANRITVITVGMMLTGREDEPHQAVALNGRRLDQPSQRFGRDGSQIIFLFSSSRYELCDTCIVMRDLMLVVT